MFLLRLWAKGTKNALAPHFKGLGLLRSQRMRISDAGGHLSGAVGVELTIAEAKARQRDGAIARLSLSAVKPIVAPSPCGEGGG
ncbi:MAG: hypothetical protein ACK5KN_03095 [Dysgonomonas sp.]